MKLKFHLRVITLNVEYFYNKKKKNSLGSNEKVIISTFTPMSQ